MQGSLVAWLTLGSGIVVLVAFVYELARPTEEPRQRTALLGMQAFGLGAIIGSLPRLFGIGHGAVEVATMALQLACTIYGFRQFMRFRAEQREREESIVE